MKKKVIIVVPVILVIVLGMLLLIINKNNNNDDILKPRDGLIIEYTSRPAFGTEEAMNNYYFIRLYSDKTLSYGNTKNNSEEKVTLTADDYNEIIDLAYSKEFQSIDRDITNQMMADGVKADITIYNSNKTIFKSGGLNPNNDLFNKLVLMLQKQTK